ncbi:MAG TPA: glycosyltransferase [Gaiellaceae bacterium]|nr:glycosyltransferase [Gaiellaceae bacterium]
MRLLVAGASAEEICGTRDAATVLAGPLGAAGAEVETVWWERGAQPFPAWTRDLTARARGADAVLWHYSPFTYATRGVPTLVPAVVRAIRRGGAPLVVLLHELVFPWRPEPRALVWAATQRAALLPVLRAAAGAVVTTNDRRDWLASHRLLPRRPLLFLPVPSNLPAAAAPDRDGGGLRIGVFGFRRDELPVEVVVDAVARVRERDASARLVLAGAPGPDRPEADAWRGAAGRAGIADALSFTGVLPADELAAAIAGLDVVVFPDPMGPTSRRGTLAAALAQGRPVVAFQGPLTWERYAAEGALDLVAPSSEALAARLVELAADPDLRARRGAAARAFHERWLDLPLVAERLLSFVREATRA